MACKGESIFIRWIWLKIKTSSNWVLMTGITCKIIVWRDCSWLAELSTCKRMMCSLRRLRSRYCLRLVLNFRLNNRLSIVKYFINACIIRKSINSFKLIIIKVHVFSINFVFIFLIQRIQAIPLRAHATFKEFVSENLVVSDFLIALRLQLTQWWCLSGLCMNHNDCLYNSNY